MGWIYMHRLSDESIEDFFRKEFGEGVRDVALVGFREVYIAYETSDGETVCLVCLVDFHSNTRSGFNFGYKGMDETMGPGVYRCPERILDQLTPTENPTARQWRERCRERIRQRREQPTLEEDDLVFFHHPIGFEDGRAHDLFRVVRRGRTGRKVRFRAVRNHRLYRITKFRDRDWSRIEGREDLLPLLQHDDEGVRQRAMAAMGLLDFDAPGRTR